MSVVCGRCGASNPEGLRFCENCDRFLGWDVTSIQSPPANRSRTVPPAPIPDLDPAPAPTPTPAPTQTPSPAQPTAAPGPSGARHASSGRSGSISSPSPRPVTQLLPVSALTTPTSTACPNCGLENDKSRRFCGRCGEWLVTPSTTAAGAPLEFREKFRRRWFGERGPYTGRLSRATVGFRLLVGAVVVAVFTAILGLANVHPILRVKDQFGHIRGTGKVAGLTAAAQPAGDRVDPTAAFAVDDVRARGWSTQWIATTAGDPEVACAAAPTAGAVPVGTTSTSLAITFPTALDVREIGFEAGLVEASERNDRWQPKTLELRWNNGECKAVNLENSADLQRFRVPQGLVGGVLITVVAGYPPVDPGTGRLDIGEVTVWQR